MRRLFARQLPLFLLLAWAVVFVPLQGRADVEGVLAEINRKPPEPRLKALIEGARKEASSTTMAR